MRINKWLHVLIIQNHCGDVWEDESEYDDTPEDRKQARADLKEYRFTGYPYRMIRRRVLNPQYVEVQ